MIIMRDDFNENRRHIPSDGILITRILVSFFLIVVSIAAIYVVVMRVMDIKILEKINLKPEPHDSISITTDTNSGNSLLIRDDKGLKFRKEDKTFAREEWIEKNGELFYFDTSGYGLNGNLKKDGQVYTFTDGKLKEIKRDTSYVYRADDDLFSSVKSSQYLVWLVDDEKEKNFFPIKYSLLNEDETDYLGTSADKQYSSPNMVKIYMSNIYYLAEGKGTEYAGRLYRMRPGAIHKEVVGVGVTGYIVLSDDVVYYCDGDKVIKAKNWRGVELKLPDNEELTEDGEIIMKVSTMSELPVVNDVGETLNVDILDLPVPDAEVKIETTDVAKVGSGVATRSNTDRKEEKVEVGVAPFDLANKEVVKVEVPEIGDGPKVVEVEAPQ